MSTFIKVKAIVTDHGDPTVGIFPCYWEVDCPFYLEEDRDDELREFFRDALAKAYAEFAEGKITVDFDYEIK